MREDCATKQIAIRCMFVPTQSIGLKRLDLFASVGILSSGSAARSMEAGLYDHPDRLNEGLDLFHISTGLADSRIDQTNKFHAYLNEKGIEHVFYTTEGAHVLKPIYMG